MCHFLDVFFLLYLVFIFLMSLVRSASYSRRQFFLMQSTQHTHTHTPNPLYIACVSVRISRNRHQVQVRTHHTVLHFKQLIIITLHCIGLEYFLRSMHTDGRCFSSPIHFNLKIIKSILYMRHFDAKPAAATRFIQPLGNYHNPFAL